MSKNIYHLYKYEQSERFIKKPEVYILVKDDNLTRLQWKQGRVIEVYTGRDRVVPFAKVKLSETTLIRPANKLCIFENVK